MLAFTMVIGSSMTVFAYDDGCVHHENEGNEESDEGEGLGIPDENTVTEELEWTDSAAFYAASGGGSASTDGSGKSESSGKSDDTTPSGDTGSNGVGNGASGGYGAEEAASGQASASAGADGMGTTACVPGHEVFRQVNSAADGTVQVYHCGILQYAAQLKDADGKAAAYEGAALTQAADGRWYLDITTADGVDAAGFTVGTAKGSTDCLSGLGISGVMLNGAAADVAGK